MRVALPNVVSESLIQAIRRAFIPVVSKDEAAPRLLLQAPNGTVYQVTVTDGGSLSVATHDGT